MRDLMSLYSPIAVALSPGEQKIASAQRAANSRPRGEDPACISTGRPCRLRGIDSGPRVPTWSPW